MSRASGAPVGRGHGCAGPSSTARSEHDELRAARVAAERRDALPDPLPDAQVELIPSGGGRFEVCRDGRPVFGASRRGRHAPEGEIVELLRR